MSLSADKITSKADPEPKPRKTYRLIRLIMIPVRVLIIISGFFLVLLAFGAVFPPDIHARIVAIRKMQPGAYRPPATILENLNKRQHFRIAKMDKSDKPGEKSELGPPWGLDDLPERFDVKCYFDQLNRLKMAEGYSLDYAYYLDLGGGCPLLYARAHNSNKLVDQNDFADEFGSMREPKNVVNAYLDHIRTDASREGFIQLAVLRLIGEQFYLYWHKHYKDTKVLSLLPAWVAFSKEEVAVSLFIFTAWGGVKFYTMRVRRNFPHSFISESETTLIPYSCGIRF